MATKKLLKQLTEEDRSFGFVNPTTFLKIPNTVGPIGANSEGGKRTFIVLKEWNEKHGLWIKCCGIRVGWYIRMTDWMSAHTGRIRGLMFEFSIDGDQTTIFSESNPIGRDIKSDKILQRRESWTGGYLGQVSGRYSDRINSIRFDTRKKKSRMGPFPHDGMKLARFGSIFEFPPLDGYEIRALYFNHDDDSIHNMSAVYRPIDDKDSLKKYIKD